MEEAIEFFKNYLQLEYDLWYKYYTDKTGEEYETLSEQIEEIELLGNSYPFPVEDEEEWQEIYEDGKDILPNRKVRTLFVAKEYKHDKFGELYSFYTSRDTKGKDTINLTFYVAKMDGEFKVISKYLVERESGGWKYQMGEEIDKLSVPVNVVKLNAPGDDDPYLKEYTEA